MAEATVFRNCALNYPIYGLPWVETFPILDADGDLVTGATGLDSEMSKNGDTFADCTAEATEIATNSGTYYLSLTGTELTTDIATVIIKTSSSGAKTTTLQIRPRKLVTLRSGTCQGGSSTTIQFDSSASAVDDYYNGCAVSAVLDGTTEVRLITDYTGSTKTATVHVAWISGDPGPDSNDTFIIYLPEGRQITQADAVAWNATAVATPATAGYPAVTIKSGTGTGELSLSSGQVILQSGTGTGQLDFTSGVVKANVTQFNGSNATSSSGRPEVNTTHIAGSAVSTSSAQIGVNIVNAGGTAWASGSLTSGVFAAGAINAAAIANNAIDAATFAADVDAEFLSYLVDDATRIDASALNTLSSHDPGETIMGATDLGTGSGFTAIPWNASWDAEVQSEVQDAIEVNHLDHLVAVADPGGVVANSSFLAKLVSKSGTPAFTSYDNTTDSLEAIRDRGDAAWTTATGFSTHTAADVWAVGTRVLTAGTNIQLPSNGLANVTAWTVAITGNITGNLSGSVGSVTTVSDKTGYALASTGLDLVVPADPGAVPALGTASVVTWIGYFGMWSKCDVESDADEVRVKNDAGTLVATHAISDNGTTFHSAEAS